MNLIKNNFFNFKESKVTDKKFFLNRRKFILGLAGSAYFANILHLSQKILKIHLKK